MNATVLRTPASRIVLVGVLGIAFLELGISGRFTALWQLAFVGKGASASSPSSPSSSPASSGRPTGTIVAL